MGINLSKYKLGKLYKAKKCKWCKGKGWYQGFHCGMTCRDCEGTGLTLEEVKK